MANFIELHKDGVTTLINLAIVQEIHEIEDGCCMLFYAFTLPNAYEQDYFYPDESYEEVKGLIWR